MRLNEEIQVKEVKSCHICRAPGDLRYSEMRDKLFGAPGVWSINYCPACDFCWLDPQPIYDDIRKIYQVYYTHKPTTNGRSGLSSLKHRVEDELLRADFGYDKLPGGRHLHLIGKLLGKLMPMAREIAGSSVMWLNAQTRGKLLDVGCGNGRFRATMEKLGWEVAGVEPDPNSARIAREQLKLPVITSTLEEASFAPDSFDCITAHQAIEHMFDPIGFLAESFRVLRPGGRLVVTTPNISGFGHLIFRRCWRGLEPPRHLHLFSTRALGICVERVGYEIETLRTTARSTWEIWYASRLICRDGKIPSSFPDKLDVRLRFEGLAVQLLQHVLLRLKRNIGEQIVLTAFKPASQLTVQL